MPDNADTTTITGSTSASTIFFTLRMPLTEPTDVPPNFNTFIVCLMLNFIVCVLACKNSVFSAHNKFFSLYFGESVATLGKKNYFCTALEMKHCVWSGSSAG